MKHDLLALLEANMDAKPNAKLSLTKVARIERDRKASAMMLASQGWTIEICWSVPICGTRIDLVASDGTCHLLVVCVEPEERLGTLLSLMSNEKLTELVRVRVLAALQLHVWTRSLTRKLHEEAHVEVVELTSVSPRIE
jgi:hypothetical protein